MQPGSHPIRLSPDAEAYIRRLRPDLAGSPLDQAQLLTTAPADIIGLVPYVLLAPPRPGLGDRLAALLHRLGIPAAVAWLQRRRLLAADCGCAARQAYLNTLPIRLRPWPLTLAVLLSWLLLAYLLSRL